MVGQSNKRITMESIVNSSPVIVISREAGKDLPVKYISNNIRQFGYTPEEFYSGEKRFADIIYPDDRKTILRAFKCLSKQLTSQVHEYRIVTKFGETRYVEDRMNVKVYDGDSVHIEGTILDITKRKHVEMLSRQPSSTGKELSRISLDGVLNILVANAEKTRPGIRCAVMLLDKKKQHICRVIAPNLPSFFIEAMDGLEVGYGVCSCGTALYIGERVLVSNIEEHPYWARHRDVALKAGLKSSFAEPILSSAGEILGVFTMYSNKSFEPKEACLKYLKANADLAAIEIEHRVAKEKFKASEHKFKTIFNNINDQIYVSELNGTIIDVNQIVVDSLGYSKDYILRSAPSDIVPSWYVQRASALIKAIEKDKKAIYETASIRKDGSIIPLEISARMIDYDGKRMILSVARDITERKKAEKAKQLNEARLEALIKLNEMTAASLYEIAEFTKEEAVRLTESKMGYLGFMNLDETAVIMHPWSNGPLDEYGVGDTPCTYDLNFTDLWSEAVRQRKAIIDNDHIDKCDMKDDSPDGKDLLKRHMSVPIFDGDHIVAVVGVGNKEEDYDDSDVQQLTLLMQGMWKLIQHKQLIGALSKYSEELAKANTELRSVNMIKAEFMAESVGKWSDPLHGYDVFDDEAMHLLDRSQKNAISTLLKNSEKLKLLIDTVLYSNMKQSGKIEYLFAPVNIGSLLSDTLLDMILQIDEKKLTLEQKISAGLPMAKGDREKLSNIFAYLIHNAIDISPEGHSIRISLTGEDDFLHIAITDTGDGIDKDLIPHMFNKAYIVNETIAKMYQGLESNLYICKETVLAHNGSIWIESEKGKGSTVHIKLPLWKDEINKEEKISTD